MPLLKVPIFIFCHFLSLFQDERCFRVQRAAQADVNRTCLPQEDWITWEDEVANGNYLTALVEEVKKENEEKKAWNNKLA